MSIPQLAPLPGVLILTTAPPLYIPTLLLSSHIRHPLKETYPRLLADQWVAHLSQHGLETSADRCEPVVWLEGVPSFPRISDDDEEEEEDDGGGGGADEEDDGRTDDGHDSSEPDEDGNVWRGLNRQARKDADVIETAAAATVASTDDGTSVANLTIGQVTYLTPVPAGTSPLLSVAFLHHLHSVLLQYFPSASASASAAAATSSAASTVGSSIPAPNNPIPIPASTLSSNFDLLYQVLQEMLDEGRPLTVDYNSLKGIVRGKAWWEDILARMSHLTSSAPAPPPQISPLPWRPSGVRYSRNEVCVDIVETLTGVMDRKGKSVGGLDLHVSIGCLVKLSGDPDLTLTLHPSPNGPSSIIGFPAFHPCVRHRRWIKDGVLSFVPPDGEFELAHFSIKADRAQSKLSSGNGASWEKDVPFSVQATRSSDKESKGKEWTFEVRIAAKSGRASPTSAEGIEVSFVVDPTAKTQTATPSASLNVDARTAVSSRSSSSSSSGGGGGTGSNHSTDDPGTWRFDAREGILRWSIPKLGSGINGPSEVTLKGSVSSSDVTNLKPSPILTHYSLPLGTPSLSGVKVANLGIHGLPEHARPFRGVRGATRGQLEWRW